MPRCYAPGCNHGSDTCRLFRYPADRELFNKWISLCRRENRYPTREDRLCSCHFIDGRKENLPTVFAYNDEALPGSTLPQAKKPVTRKMTDTKKVCEEIKVRRKKDIKFDDFTAECRACLKTFDSDTGLINILEGWPPPWNAMETTIGDDLAKISNIQISMADQHSKVICKACYCKLHKACLFSNMVHDNDLVLKRRNFEKIDPDSVPDKIWPKPIQVNKSITGNMLENAMEIEIKQEVLSDEEFDNNMSCFTNTNVTDLSNVEIKIEPEEIIEQKPLQITVNGTISLNQFHAESLTNGDANNYRKEEYSDPVIKEEPLSEDEEMETTPDLPLECMLCTKEFTQMSGLKAHVIAHHSYKSVKRKTEDDCEDEKPLKHVCAICRRSFVTSTDLMVHETCHNKEVCYGCSDKFDTFDQLLQHRECCKAILNKSNTAHRLKTLDDVIRPHPASPQLSEEQETKGADSLTNSDDSSENSMKIHLEIHSIGSEPKENESDQKIGLGIVDETMK